MKNESSGLQYFITDSILTNDIKQQLLSNPGHAGKIHQYGKKVMSNDETLETKHWNNFHIDIDFCIERWWHHSGNGSMAGEDKNSSRHFFAQKNGGTKPRVRMVLSFTALRLYGGAPPLTAEQQCRDF
ncbi:MAG: hypothetical protein IJV89_10950 [Lentisphaeria bacterium]|nr:hypothetical protein [Lentisphaeria bacterium]